MPQAKTLDQFVETMEEAFEQYFTLHQQDPLFNGIWAMSRPTPSCSASISRTACRRALPAKHLRADVPMSIDKLMVWRRLITQLALPPRASRWNPAPPGPADASGVPQYHPDTFTA